MKQYITPQQLSELSIEARAVLKKTVTELWGSSSGFDMILSIGQMIEILDNKGGVTMCVKADGKGNGQWCVEGYNYEFRNLELCDALWEAVKETLNS